MLTVDSWKYNGAENYGIPPRKINDKMIVLEKALKTTIDTSNPYQHVYSRTGNNLKEFVYYCSTQEDFMNELNRKLAKHDKYPIDIDFYEDEQWSEFKKLMDDIKNGSVQDFVFLEKLESL